MSLLSLPLRPGGVAQVRGGASPHPRQLAHVREDADAGDGFMHEHEDGWDAPLPGEEVRFPGPCARACTHTGTRLRARARNRVGPAP